jgi:pimeloyl-ACP methyl ester carboxylesterase
VAEYANYRQQAGRIRMRVLDWSGDGPPVLFLHGFTANGLAALRIGDLLYGHRRLIAPDLRGRGKSDMPVGEYGINTHLADVMGLLDRLGIDQFVAAGHSFGATLSVFLAAQCLDRVRGLMLFDGGAVPSPLAVQLLDHYYSTLQYSYPDAETYVNRFKESALYQPWTDELEILIRSNLYAQPDGSFMRNVPRYVVNADRRAGQMDAWAQLPDCYRQIECPVLIVRAGLGIMGKADQILNDEVIGTMLEGLPQAQIVTVEAAGHTSLLSIPSERRDRAILEFLGTISQPLA